MAPLRCTYRLQLGPDLGFAAARELVPYLQRLGISHLYLSPSLQARSGSTHGYDVVDPTRMSASLGGEDEFAALAGAGLGVILDIVPNHMGIGEENRWWSDPGLRARFFDLDPVGGGYRRFFDIDDLAAVRQEDPLVFETTHRRVLELVRDGLVDGLRVDHPDGLADPAGYLAKLRACGVSRVWVEKILAVDEELRDWPVTGTVGYEFLNDVCALFVDPAGLAALDALAASFTGEARRFAVVAALAQREQARGTFARELARLERVAPPGLGTDAIADGLVGLGVYRTYLDGGAVAPADREAIAAAGMAPALEAALLDDDEHSRGASDGDVASEFVTRFQQTSPAVTAKGVEDTAFYRSLRLLALNEVGGDPDRFGLSVADFHERSAARAARFPQGLLVTQTHDTKRSGDARARIGALAGLAGPWSEHVLRWRECNAGLRTGAAPDGSEEYLLYQTLIGVWPVSAQRLTAYLTKALREAKRNTSWAAIDEAWEAGVLEFAGRVITHQPFLADFVPFCERVALEGERSALGQLLLKLTCPGIPDIYQGDELWSLALVDPDNRRPVDWAARDELLGGLEAGIPATRVSAKLALIHRALDLRRRRPEAFAGPYTPVAAQPGVCSFTRGAPAEVLVAVAVRPDDELVGPASGWTDLLGPGPWSGLGLYERD